MTQLSIVFEKILDSIHKVFTNIFGWIIAIFTAYLSWLGNDSGSFLLVLVALIWDMAWGIAAAVKHHNFVLSYLLRETFCKIIVYVGAMSIVLLAERMLGIESGFTVKIIENIDKLPHPIRMENGVAWLYIDVLEQYGIDEKIHLFNQ
jgi:hypothetical protein